MGYKTRRYFVEVTDVVVNEFGVLISGINVKTSKKINNFFLNSAEFWVFVSKKAAA
jgi:hypothetical protein